jgi:FAD/FMN-containing dehydrogenase
MAAGAEVLWTNWVGNQSFTARRIETPRDEDEVAALLREAGAAGTTLRPVGAGHSFTPLIENPGGVVLDQSALSGVTACDEGARTVTALPGTPISAFGDVLWERGLALANQGDIDTQAIAGAVATGTHGSGVALGSFSSTVVSARLATGRGEVLELGSGDEELLRAARVSIGTLGVFTSLTLQAVPAYHLDEWIGLVPVEEVLERWDELRDGHRHFSFFWLPTEASAALYGLTAGAGAADRCYVKVYDEVPEGTAAADGHRVERGYRVYPSIFEKNFHEMEHMLPLASGREAFTEIRDLVRRRFPDCIFPVEIRFTAADDAMLSPNYRTPTTVVSVSGQPGTDYWPFLHAVDEVFQRYGGRPHWGKLHFMTPERMERLFPELERFREIRRELDPQGVLLNDHLRPLLA